LDGNAYLYIIIDAGMMLCGLFFIVDGFLWCVPAERTRREYPYCYGTLEIAMPDYGVPGRFWKKVVFTHE